MIQYDKNFDHDSILTFVINSQSDPAIGQVQLCHNLIVFFDYLIFLKKEIVHLNKY